MSLLRVWPVPRARYCRCAHSEFVHELDGKGVRTWCTFGDGTGQCPCRKFTAKEEPT